MLYPKIALRFFLTCTKFILKSLFVFVPAGLFALFSFYVIKSIFATLIYRLYYIRKAFISYPNMKTWRWCFGVSVIYTLVAFPVGITTEFLRFYIVAGSWRKFIILPLVLLVQPSILEELIFRALLLPHPLEKSSSKQIVTKSFISLFLFVAYHPFIGILTPQTRQLFTSISFLIQTVFIGLACTIVYLISGSIWPPVLIHWLPVTSWILFFGGAKNIARAKWFQSI